MLGAKITLLLTKIYFQRLFMCALGIDIVVGMSTRGATVDRVLHHHITKSNIYYVFNWRLL